jgi:hypothetical protein
MAHFLAIVLVEPGGPEPAAAAEARMMPYFDRDLLGPAARCDGFTVGGQYDGELWGREQHHTLAPAEFRARYGLDVVRPEDNIRPVAAIRPGLIPYAVVTPDGAWRDCEGKDDTAWAAEWSALREEFRDHLAVAVDCHC